MIIVGCIRSIICITLRPCWLMSSSSEPTARVATGHWIVFSSGALSRCKQFAAFAPSREERAMTDLTYVQQLRKTISGEFYFGAMCRETKRRIAISTDTSRGKQRYSQSGETIVSCNHCHKTHRLDNRDIPKSDGNERFYFADDIIFVSTVWRRWPGEPPMSTSMVAQAPVGAPNTSTDTAET